MTSAAAELIGAMLGTLFLTLGVAAAVAATLRAERRDRALLWFGVATALYGLRLIVRSEAVREVLPDASWLRVEHFITYIIIVPGALLAESALPTASRGVLRFMWRANLAAAAVALAWDLSASRSGAAMPLNQAAVVANITILLVLVAIEIRSRRLTRDAWIVLAGVAVFAATALYETIRGGLFEYFDLEPAAMLVLVGCLGYVVVKHVFHSERRMAAVGRELETARRIQQSILPKGVPSVPGLAVATHYDSMSEVAGDLFDFVVTPSGQLGVLVADVSGHGVPAAIVASMVKIALAVQEGEIDDPGAVLTRMNRALCGRFELAYVTAVFALIDPVAGTLTYASAGHPAPLLLRVGGSPDTGGSRAAPTGEGATVESLDEREMVLGFLPDVTYTSTVVRELATGDRVVFYTDGITEASRADGEFYGDRRFQEIMLAGLAQSPDGFTASLVADARQWAGQDFADDVTVVVIDRIC
jgi:sigma-B regulation protein RsbU (phosphoserine phosphatase)